MILTVRRPGQPDIRIDGECVWCRFLSKRYHLVGVRSESPVPVRELVGHQQWLESCARNPDVQAPLAGRLVVCSSNDLSSRSVFFQLRGTKLELSLVTTPGALLDTVETAGTDAVVLDADSDDIDASQLLLQCRERAFTGPLVLISMDPETEYLAGMDPLSRTRCVLLPLRNDAIAAALRDVLREHPECIVDTAPIYSDAPATLPNRGELLKTYIEQVQMLCERAVVRFDADHPDDTIRLIRSLAASGGSHGFTSLSDSANRCLSMLTASPEDRRIPSGLRSLQSVARRLRSDTAA
ncbi:MAG: hypothetical protein ACTS22_04380 [Phycisphaerales bacterium]